MRLKQAPSRSVEGLETLGGITFAHVRRPLQFLSTAHTQLLTVSALSLHLRSLQRRMMPSAGTFPPVSRCTISPTTTCGEAGSAVYYCIDWRELQLFLHPLPPGILVNDACKA